LSAFSSNLIPHVHSEIYIARSRAKKAPNVSLTWGWSKNSRFSRKILRLFF